MKKGNIKTINNKGLKFDVQATDEYALIVNEETKVLESKQIGIIITDVPENKYGIKKGMKMSLVTDSKKNQTPATQITAYLSTFKNAEGNKPDEIKVAVLVEKYCNNYMDTHGIKRI